MYDSEPKEIADNILEGVNQIPERTRKAKKVITVLDRKEAIAKALSIAEKEDIILLTGKGSEQFLVLPGNKRVEWDERKVVKDILEI